jgi:predicted double-glycine peptidase
MNLWLEAIGATSVAFAGALLGYFFSRLPKPYWTFGYFIPLALVLIYGIAIHFPAMSFTPPISWMMMGRKKFAILGFIAAMVLTTPLSRLPLKRDRTVISILMAVVIFFLSVWPFLAPAFNRNQLAQLQTRIDGDGVCHQNTGYTCGPAAAVTALRKLGLPAEEGQLAILSFTSSMTGTPPDILAEILQKQYGKDGLAVEYRTFKNISELKSTCPVLAVMKFGFMVDHYVTVLEVTDSEVVVGDPLDGLDKMSYEEFQNKWRFVGIVLHRK